MGTLFGLDNLDNLNLITKLVSNTLTDGHPLRTHDCKAVSVLCIFSLNTLTDGHPLRT